MRKLSTFVLWLSSISILSLLVFLIIYYHKPPLFFPKWKEYQVYGLDVSKYQREIDWERVKQKGFVFTLIKATEGSWKKDKMFEYNWQETKKNKIIRGAYHYYHPSVNWKDQFDNITETVYLKSGDLPIVIDIEKSEKTNKVAMVKNLKKLLIALENHYNVRPIVYTYESFYNDYFQNQFREYNLWIANYSNYRPELLDGAKWEIWQYSEVGSIEGVPCYVDLNCFYGSQEDLNRLLKK